MLILILLTVVFISITYAYVRWIKLKQYWAKRGVPHLPPHPLLGSMTFLRKENPAVWYRRIYENFKEPYVGLWVFWRPALLINSEEIARNIFIRDQANFRNRFVTSGTTDPIGRLMLFTLKDPLWSIIRKKLSPLFTGSKLRGVQTLVTEKSKQLVERIDKERQKPYPVELKNLLIDFTTDIVGTASFGVKSDATITGKSPIKTMTKELTKYEFFRALSWCSAFYIPELVDFFRFKMFPPKTVEYMRKMLQVIIAQRGGLENKVTEPRDLLDILIKIKQDNDEELEMTEDMMLAQAAVFLQGGFETSGTTLSFAIYELAFSSDVQVKLLKELQRAKDTYRDGLLDASVLSQLTYLNCVVNETLRKYPLFGAIDRVALEDYKVDDYLTIKAGTPVFINTAGLHYDPVFFPEPQKFNPDRFLPDSGSSYKHFAYMPFGEGPRKCIGQRLGLTNVRHGLAAVILNYEVKPLPNTPKPTEVTLNKTTVFITPENILSVEFVPRK